MRGAKREEEEGGVGGVVEGVREEKVGYELRKERTGTLVLKRAVSVLADGLLREGFMEVVSSLWWEGPPELRCSSLEEISNQPSLLFYFFMAEIVGQELGKERVFWVREKEMWTEDGEEKQKERVEELERNICLHTHPHSSPTPPVNPTPHSPLPPFDVLLTSLRLLFPSFDPSFLSLFVFI
jgi:hypothetical protein